jgi:hypothetical protein
MPPDAPAPVFSSEAFDTLANTYPHLRESEQEWLHAF